MTKTSMLLNFGQDIIEYITGFFGDFLYNTIGHIIILLLDWLQSIFRGLAGLEGMKINGQSVNGVGEDSYDIVYWLIGTDIIMEIFWSMILFSAVLLIIMTIIALVRNTYEEKQKPVWDIISSSFKGLLGFIIVPAFAVVGLMFSNVILRTIDAGTSFGNSSMMSTNLFMSAAYDANKLRGETVTDCEKAFKQIVDKTNFESYKNVQSYYDGIGTLTLQDYHNTLAPLLDEAFTGGQLKRGSSDVLTPQDTIDVKICYATFEINYLILLAGGCVLVGVFFKMCWGMIGRIFKLCFDFVLIPVVNAMIPFDGGNAMKSWKGDFVKNVTMAYGTVGILNLYFSILPVVNDIQFNNGGLQSTGFFSAIFKLILQIVGIFSASSIMSTVNGWFGVGDVVSAGDSTFKAFQGGLKSIKSGFGVKDKAKKATKKAMAIQGAYLGGRKASNAKGLKAFGAGLLGAFGQTEAGKTMQELNFVKNVNEAKKKGADYIKEARTYTPSTMQDLFSTGTDATDIRTARLDLEKTGKGYNKKYDDLQRKLAGLAPGSKEYNDLQEKIWKAKAGEGFVQQLQKGGAKITVGTETGKMQEFDDQITEREEKLSKSESAQSSVESYAAAMSRFSAANTSLSKIGGFDSDKFKKYVRGEINDVADIATTTLTPEQEDMANEARSEYRTMMNESLNSIVSVYQAKKSVFVGKTYNGHSLTESYIKGITDPDEALGVLEHMSNFIRDYNKVARQIATQNKIEKDAIKKFKNDVNEAKAKLADNVASNPGTIDEGVIKNYIDGGKS